MLIAEGKTMTRQTFDPRPYKVTKIIPDQVTATRAGIQRIRNIRKYKS